MDDSNKNNFNQEQTRHLETHFKTFRDNVVGSDQTFTSPYGKQKILYADWTASGRLYRPIETKLLEEIGPFVANTHTETSITGSVMTHAYSEARNIIKKHVNASSDDILITVGTGMTGAINKFQRILGIKLNENLKAYTKIPNHKRPIVFVSHMEHHSNQTSWIETIAKVVVIPSNNDGLPCLGSLENLVRQYKDFSIKIAAITGCSNVTGIRTNYYNIAKLMHQNNGLCFVDFACSAPYVNMDMHPNDEEAYLDAITFSPHKFLGGPGTSGVLIFNKKLYKNLVPDNPGGGTVSYTNPWGDHDYIDDIETREDGGTPGFLQTIKIALSIQLKEEMGVQNILEREHELNAIIFKRLSKIKNLKILAPKQIDRLGIISFYIEDAHYNLIVKLLNDRFGVQTRGGCSCAGTYGHYLLNVNQTTSKAIEQKILAGCLIERPGWVRMSIHPIMENSEVEFICNAIKEVSQNFKSWGEDYTYNTEKNEFIHKSEISIESEIIKGWFCS
ncbi:aminotransferase class V-fold PLP-dependent enzyme [Winogradskyella bathintestinalis]|uniref:Aminotransferase class V-fold PLP-dependent enzyme n=1 Tax=Winogradskyella bathintestinalis TaxID=3035208 RepID=A0ABT7ZWK0_9FLAO|nr:aminotransferase class V-fold PLP-dependent enzyme [Winogradskyella bathintestinalis]MDN3493384.1 aminotransferase class V-fold PLP-dependent enzyme [Winogradskyella bathintestinalis]